MAYSDYGGYGYKNNKLVIERSDATIDPENQLFGVPGMYPGFAMMIQGDPPDEAMKKREWPSGHVILGNAPLFLVMHKQSTAHIHNGHERVYEMDYDWESDDQQRDKFELNGTKIEWVYEQSDNYYQYAKITEPDGTVWHGFSGYGVGAGLEDGGHGFSTEDQIERLGEIFPEFNPE